MSCDHEDLIISPDVVEEEATPPFRVLKLRVRCDACHEYFHFRGISSGHPNPDMPATSADGYELRAPILPGPGAVVGLMVKTGLEDKLVNPLDQQNGTQ